MMKWISILLSALFLVPLTAIAAISFDNSAIGVGAIVPGTVTASLTSTSSNEVQVACAFVQNNASRTIATVKDNGVNMSTTKKYADITSAGRVLQFYDTNSTTTVHNFTWTISGGSNYRAILEVASYKGVSLTAPIDNAGINSTSANTNFTETLTATSSGAWPTWCVIDSDTIPTVGTNTLLVQGESTIGTMFAANFAAVGAGLTWTFNASTGAAGTNWGAVMMHLSPAVSAAGSGYDANSQWWELFN